MSEGRTIRLNFCFDIDAVNSALQNSGFGKYLPEVFPFLPGQGLGFELQPNIVFKVTTLPRAIPARGPQGKPLTSVQA